MKNDCELIAKKNDIEFKWNTKFPINSLYLMRGYLIIKDDLKKKYFDVCFDAYWKNNIDIADEKNTDSILETVGQDKIEFIDGIKETKTKEELKRVTKNAFEIDIFGAPTFVVNNKIFWGQDRLNYAIDEYNS